MANFKDSPTFAIHDDYYTTEETWSLVKDIIPKDIVIWEACMLNATKSKSPEILESITSNKVLWNKNIDILKDRLDPASYDMIITNIPFETELKKKILAELVKIDKPFLIIMNSCNMFSKYIRTIFKENIKHLQIITPSTKIHYAKLLQNGELEYKKNTSFYSVFVAYKMNLTTEQLWV